MISRIAEIIRTVPARELLEDVIGAIALIFSCIGLFWVGWVLS